MSRDSKALILKTATRLFAQRGYKGTSLQAIADEVGMRKPSLLYHYPSKDAIRAAVLGELLERWKIRLPEILAVATSGTDRFTALFSEVSSFFRSDPHRAMIVMREVVDRPSETRDILAEVLGPWLGLLVRAIKDGQEAGRVRPEVDPESYLVQCIVLIIGSVIAADLSGFLYPDHPPGEHRQRQVDEVVRIAHSSLFLSPPI
jgi:TetR/AcrR family transcriptional regulator